eukprot:1095343-Pyramimonas_sp.AAC.1
MHSAKHQHACFPLCSITAGSDFPPISRALSKLRPNRGAEVGSKRPALLPQVSYDHSSQLDIVVKGYNNKHAYKVG